MSRIRSRRSGLLVTHWNEKWFSMGLFTARHGNFTRTPKPMMEMAVSPGVLEALLHVARSSSYVVQPFRVSSLRPEDTLKD